VRRRAGRSPPTFGLGIENQLRISPSRRGSIQRFFCSGVPTRQGSRCCPFGLRCSVRPPAPPGCGPSARRGIPYSPFLSPAPYSSSGEQVPQDLGPSPSSANARAPAGTHAGRIMSPALFSKNFLRLADGCKRSMTPRCALGGSRTLVTARFHGRPPCVAAGTLTPSCRAPDSRDASPMIVTETAVRGEAGASVPLRFGAAEPVPPRPPPARRLIGSPTAPASPCAFGPRRFHASFAARRYQAGDGFRCLCSRRDEGARRMDLACRLLKPGRLVWRGAVSAAQPCAARAANPRSVTVVARKRGRRRSAYEAPHVSAAPGPVSIARIEAETVPPLPCDGILGPAPTRDPASASRRGLMREGCQAYPTPLHRDVFGCRARRSSASRPPGWCAPTGSPRR